MRSFSWVCSLCFTALFRLVRQYACVCVFAFFKLFSYFFSLLTVACMLLLLLLFFLFTFYSSSLLLLRFHTRSPFEFVYACVHIVNGWFLFFSRAIIVPEHFYFSFVHFFSLPLSFSLSFGRPFKFFDTIPIKPHLHFLPLSFCVCVFSIFLFLFFFYSFRFISFNLPYYSSVHIFDCFSIEMK